MKPQNVTETNKKITQIPQNLVASHSKKYKLIIQQIFFKEEIKNYYLLEYDKKMENNEGRITSNWSKSKPIIPYRYFTAVPTNPSSHIH